MNSQYNTDYDYFINIETDNYIETYDHRNNAVYSKMDLYINPELMYNNHQLVNDIPYKNIDFSVTTLITNIIGGFVVCIITFYIIRC